MSLYHLKQLLSRKVRTVSLKPQKNSLAPEKVSAMLKSRHSPRRKSARKAREAVSAAASGIVVQAKKFAHDTHAKE